MRDRNRQKQFEGYFNTPTLWNGSLEELCQFELPPIQTPKFNAIIDKKLRLGHLVEEFVHWELQHLHDVKVLARNFQVQRENQTLGEFDFIIEHANQIKQVEVSFKFYVYDQTVGDTEVEHWIGPNRKDSLIQKIKKIKERQFPLVNELEAIGAIDELKIDPSRLEQTVYFKGQLFVPFNQKIDQSTLNQECIVGEYLKRSQLLEFEDYKFYIPNKHDWLITPLERVDWIGLDQFKSSIHDPMENERSVLAWFKSSKGIISKVFVVWW